MKKTFTAASVFLALTLCLGIVIAAGGDANDPLISLSYLEGLFKQETHEMIDLAIDDSETAIRDNTDELLEDLVESATAAAGQNFADVPLEVTLNQGDSLSGSTGLSITTLAGEIVLDITLGTVIDVTTGEEIPTGSVLIPNHRYIVAENSAASFIGSGSTAILSYQGNYTYTPNPTAIDYFGIALALRELGLFRGSGSGIGEGFDLHLAPTRAEALVMFIRMLGEEDEALACTYEHPFTDVPSWLDRYAAWAWNKGYTNGVGNNKFGSTQTVSSVEYQEFILRALGYSVAGVDNYLTSLERAWDCGALTDTEYFLLKDHPFLRSQVAYISFYNLDTIVAGSYMTLAQKLQQQDVFTFQQLVTARSFISSTRLH